MGIITSPGEIRSKIDDRITEILYDGVIFHAGYIKLITPERLRSGVIDYSANEQVELANGQRTKSILWYFLTRTNRQYFAFPKHHISGREIGQGTQHRQNDNAIGTDNAPPEIFKIWCDRYAHHLAGISKFRDINEFREGRGTGIPTLLRKSGDERLLRNSRPIALLTTIYKIWDTVMGNRLTHILNLITRPTNVHIKQNGPLWMQFATWGNNLFKTRLSDTLRLAFRNPLAV